MLKSFSVILLFLAVASGCISVPQNSALLLEADDAIVVMRNENDKLIKALGDIQRAILDEKFEQIYLDVEAKYRQSREIPGKSPLSQEQNMDVTANVIGVRDRILAEIAAKEELLYEQSRSNFDKLHKINEALRKYFDSLQNMKEARQEVIQNVSTITGFDISEVQKLVRDPTSYIRDKQQ